MTADTIAAAADSIFAKHAAALGPYPKATLVAPAHAERNAWSEKAEAAFDAAIDEIRGDASLIGFLTEYEAQMRAYAGSDFKSSIMRRFA